MSRLQWIRVLCRVCLQCVPWWMTQVNSIKKQSYEYIQWLQQWNQSIIKIWADIVAVSAIQDNASILNGWYVGVQYHNSNLTFVSSVRPALTMHSWCDLGNTIGLPVQTVCSPWSIIQVVYCCYLSHVKDSMLCWRWLFNGLQAALAGSRSTLRVQWQPIQWITCPYGHVAHRKREGDRDPMPVPFV